MRRLLLLLVVTMLALGVVAGPAAAWYAPKAHTAYVSPFDKSGWAEWAGPSDPLNAIPRTGRIPHGWNVVISLTWMDSETGAKLAPIVFDHTFKFSNASGTWSKKALSPWRTVRFWSPAYAWDSVGSPGFFASDWWVPLGKLARGTYKGWVRETVVSAYPTWVDDQGALVADPIWSPGYSVKWARSFKVK